MTKHAQVCGTFKLSWEFGNFSGGGSRTDHIEAAVEDVEEVEYTPPTHACR